MAICSNFVHVIAMRWRRAEMF